MIDLRNFAHSLRPIFICIVLYTSSCGNESMTEIDLVESNYAIDTSNIPQDTIDFNDPRVTFENGLYHLDQNLYTGIVYKVLKGYNLQTYSSVYEGKLHGSYSSYFQNGNLSELRTYKNGLAHGTHYGYWEETGNLKYEYNYYNQKKEGTQRNWYANGEPYYEYNYKNDKLEGLQKSWRENGSLYRNFIVKDDVRYGLQKSTQCYELTDEEIK